MVTNIEAPGPQPRPLKRMGVRSERPHPNPAFPLCSPPFEDVTALKPRTGTQTLAFNNPFLPSNPFASGSSDDDSSSSSGQDEFHLERYSQDAKNTSSTQIHRSRRNSSRRRKQKPSTTKPARKPRPGLNIVTSFSTQAKRSHTDGLAIDNVHSQRPQLGRRYATSVVSAKAEHVGGSTTETGHYRANHTDTTALDRYIESIPSKPPASRRSMSEETALDSQEVQVARKETNGTPAYPDPLHSALRLPNPATTGAGSSPQARSIVIGLSVPANEADAHLATNGGDSALSGPTPDTPAIVVTPAEDTESWKPRFFRGARPPSSIYSAFPRDQPPSLNRTTPPVPKIARAHIDQHRSDSVTPDAIITETLPSERQHHALESNTYDEKDIGLVGGASRVSSESQELIMPSSALESGRPRSQGWWNLMLSPMLSRKCTILDKQGPKSADISPLPSEPAMARTPNTVFVSPTSPESPETPRRLGLANARASVWSRWTSCEKERSGSTQTKHGAETSHRVKRQEPIKSPEPLPTRGSDGLAAEYYHASAIEQLSGVHYFECQNHSCAEGLPRLQSVFDFKAAQHPSTSPKNVDGVNESTADVDVPLSRTARIRSGMTCRTEPEELSPNVRQADAAAMMKARSVETLELPGPKAEKSDPEALPARSGPEPRLQEQKSSPVSEPHHGPMQYPSTAANVLPRVNQHAVMSPGPVSPAVQQRLESQGAVPMTEIQQSSDRFPMAPAAQPAQHAIPSQVPASTITIHNHSTHAGSPAGTSNSVLKARSAPSNSRLNSVGASSQVDTHPNGRPKGDGSAATKDPGVLSKLSCLYRRKIPRAQGNAMANKRRWTMIMSVPLGLIMLTCILLAIFLTRTGDDTPVQSQWLNLTGYPPIPTGISTIGRPEPVKQQSQCVAPTTLWSCALPKESQAEVAPNNADQPNFRFGITFRNNTVPANMTIALHSRLRRSAAIERRAKDPFTNDLFEPNPTPPSRADQLFMGNTTDNITQPSDGEQTPFFITFIPVFPVDPSNVTSSRSTASRLLARQPTNSSDSIPAPDVLDDGSAAPANLLPTSPYPTCQPIRLYNRGQVDEHYGFYMYYDKAIFLKSTAAINTSEFSNNAGIAPDDQDGGAVRDQSRLRCTFSQTRFLVRMWTNPAFGATLLSPATDAHGTNGTGSSATTFNRPGSFPYPTTLSLDRHGGNINKKAVYCYGVDELQVIQTDVKSIVPEARGTDGTLINPAPPLVNGTIEGGNGNDGNGTDTEPFDQDAGGIDGGTGGCECVWQNWN